VAFGGDVRFKQPRAVLLGHALAVVDDFDENTVTVGTDAGNYAAFPVLGKSAGFCSALDRFGGVLDEVGNRLGDETPVDGCQHLLSRHVENIVEGCVRLAEQDD